MRRRLEHVSYALICGALAFVLTGGLFALWELILKMPLLEPGSVTLYYLVNLAVALAGGVVLGSLGYRAYCGVERKPMALRPDMIACALGPLLAVVMRLFTMALPNPAGPPVLSRGVSVSWDSLTWMEQLWHSLGLLFRLAAHHPTPAGREWLILLILPIAFSMLAVAQPYLIRRLCREGTKAPAAEPPPE